MAGEDKDPPDGGDPPLHDEPYSLGEPAKDVYSHLETGREQVLQMGRNMAELTIPSVMPPDQYEAGDDLPGNNQSVGSQCVNNLSSKLMFMAFPPGQPIMKLEPIVTKLQKEIDKDPELYARVLLGLSALELEHRKRALTTGLTTAWTGYMKLLLVAGNALWKHITLETPTYHRPDCYVVSRDRSGHPVLTIHKEVVRVSTMDREHQRQIYASTPDLKKAKEWEREAEVYSVCRLCTHEDGEDRYWEYWQEYEGETLSDTEVTTDYDDCPMWPGWLIPVYGGNWGRSYCEEYRGDLYILESNASALNDGASAAAWLLMFVKPGTRTSLKQVRQAKNLDILSGSAEDVTTLKTDKAADFQFVQNNFNQAARRVGTAFLLQSAARREGERVTAEEVQRVGQELDQAMGGLYTEIAQGHQRRMLFRFIRLHEESNKDLPPIPEGVVEVGVITGIDAMGRSSESQALREFANALTQTFGPQAAQGLSFPDFANRLGASMGVKPDGLVKSAGQVEEEASEQRAAAAGASAIDKATGPMAGAVAQSLLARSEGKQIAQQQEGAQ